MLWALGMGGRERLYVDFRDSTHSTLLQFTFSFLFLFPYFLSIVLSLKNKYIGSLFNSHHCHLYSILESSTIEPTLLLLLILEKYTCIVCGRGKFFNTTILYLKKGEGRKHATGSR